LELLSGLLGRAERLGALLSAGGRLSGFSGLAGLENLLIDAHDLLGLSVLLGHLHRELLLLLHLLRLQLQLLELPLACGDLGGD
jgi:hypothetical protein